MANDVFLSLFSPWVLLSWETLRAESASLDKDPTGASGAHVLGVVGCKVLHTSPGATMGTLDSVL